MLHRLRTPITVMGALALVAGTAQAATDTATFDVTASVADSCTVAATNLSFGGYDPNAGTAVDATSTITASCTENTSYELGLDTGNNGANASATTRAMVGGTDGDFLDYEVYTDSGRTTVWNDISGTNTVTQTSAGGDEDHTVYGRIPASQYVIADSYSDTITVTISY